MSHGLRFLAPLLVLVCCAWRADAMQSAPLERGTAIPDPLVLRELDRGSFGLGRFLVPPRSVDAPIADGEFFSLPSMAPVRRALDAEFDRYIARHKDDHPSESIGVADSNDLQLFDRAQLYSDNSRFVLSGIVNRMDRAYVAPETCGQIGLTPRRTPTNGARPGDTLPPPPLPMTLNVVL